MWKVCQNILPTKDNLIKRRVPVTPHCEVCGNANESVLHALKDCSWAATVWGCCVLGFRVAYSPSGDVGAWLREIYSLVGDDKMALVMTIMWAIWHNRNLVVFEGVRKEPQYTAYVAQRYLAEFLAVQEGGMAGPKGSGARWKPPAVGRFKLNADGALFKEASCVGFGVVVRDHEGQIIAAASKRKTGLFDVPYIEAMAIQFAAEFARDLDLRDVDLEGDNLEVIAALNSRTLVRSGLGLIIEDVQAEATSSFVSCHFSPVCRQGNEVAHGLAKYAKFVDDVFIWMEEIPSCVRNQAVTDLTSLTQ